MKRKTKKLSRRKNHYSFSSMPLPLILVIILLIVIAVKVIISSLGNNTILGTTTYLARGDDSGSSGGDGDSSGSGSSGSGSSGDSNSDSGSSGSSGSSDSGSSGSGSSDNGSGSGSSGSGNENNLRLIGPQPTSSFRPSPTPVRIDEETKDELTGNKTRVQVDERQTRLEQEIFEGGVRKRVEMRNENGRILVRVKTKDAFGNETDQRLELRPEEGIARLRVAENGVEKDIKVRVQNDRFIIEQEGFGFVGPDGTISAITSFPLTVNTETNSIAVTTPIGTFNVQQLPAKAIEQVLTANVIDTVMSIELDESEEETTDPNKQVVYRIKGVKNTRFLGFIKVDAPILAEVSAINGQTTLVKQPWYLNAFGFLFVK